MDEILKNVESTIIKTKKDLEASMKESKNQILVKVSGMEKKVVEETNETRINMRRMSDKFKEDFDYANDQIK